jgi:type 1 glutamine amidotransferase
MEILGRKTGAFEAVVSDDPRLLLSDRLPQFDVLVMNNIHERAPFLPDDFKDLDAQQKAAAKAFDEAVKGSILEFVRGGKGIVGIHAATAAFQDWPQYGEMMGAYYGGHIHQEVAVKLDDPQHPVNACFGGKPWRILDEVYIPRDPYSRAKLRVLMSLDLSAMDDPGKRPDRDYAISWVRKYGEGRVFYTTLGHALETYWNPQFLEHLLAGIQFAAGDLPGKTEPNAD